MGLCYSVLLCLLHGLSAAVLVIIAAANWASVWTIRVDLTEAAGDGWFGYIYEQTSKYGRVKEYFDRDSDEIDLAFDEQHKYERKWEKKWDLFTGIKLRYYTGNYDWIGNYNADTTKGFWKACVSDIMDAEDTVEWSWKCRKDPRSRIYIGVAKKLFEQCPTGKCTDPDREEREERQKRFDAIVGEDLRNKLREWCPSASKDVCDPGPTDEAGYGGKYPIGLFNKWRTPAFVPGGHGAKVNDVFRQRMTWAIFGLFSIFLALWDICLIVFRILGVKMITKLDHRFLRGLMILGFSLITLGVSADVGIAGGSLGIVISVAWFVCYFVPGSRKSSETEEKEGSSSGS